MPKLRGRVARAISVAAPMVALLALCSAAHGAPSADDRVKELEAQLRATQARVVELQTTLDTLAADVAALKAEPGSQQKPTELKPPDQREPSGAGENIEAELRVAMLVPDLGGDERDKVLTGRPELFVQSGFAAGRIEDATPVDAPTHFSIYRAETRWSGRLSERIGMGFELQFQTAPEGKSEELLNDAFVEYYPNDTVTLRAGQFIKPFGFEVQQSSSTRESPERAMFEGYFFPGERDRGAMIAADLSRLADWLDGTSFYGGVFNGNRFFNDNNDALNVNLRVRKQFPNRPFAIGVSWEHGGQLLPPGSTATDRSTVYGVDAQWVFGRLGIRAEYVRGDMPSTLLGLEPVFAAGFTPGEKTAGATAFFAYRLTADDELYWRWDRLYNDPVTRADVHASNLGYLRKLGEHSRIGFDYQWKDGVTFNDDAVNNSVSIRWNVVY
jgi:hypothetical protein